MQNYKEINGNDYVKDSRTTINETMQSIQSMNSGTAFPTSNLFEGMKCYRTDLKKTYTLTDVENNTWVEDAHAALADEATHAASATKLQTARTLSLTGKASGSASFDGSANASINVTNVNADTASKLSTARKINITGDASGAASFDGTGNISINTTVNESKHAAAATTVNATAANGGAADLVFGTMAANDYARIRVYGKDDNGALEIATADGGTEPIYVRQYAGAYDWINGRAGTVFHEIALLDSNGNTSFPGTVTAPTFSGSLNGNATTATKATTANNVENNIFYSSDATNVVSGDKLLVVKRAKAGVDNVPNNGLVLQTGANDQYNGQLYITDNGNDGVWVNGWSNGTRGSWTRLVENKGSWNINSSTATKLQTPRTISLTGNASGNATFDGSGNVSINTTVSESKHASDVKDATVSMEASSIDGTSVMASGVINQLSNLTGSNDLTSMSKLRSFVGSVFNGNWYNVISSRHRNGTVDGNSFGFLLYTGLADDSSFRYRKQHDSNYWTEERTLLDSSNYNAYAPTKTGSGASGTWGINITGNADTVDGYHASDIIGKITAANTGGIIAASLTENGYVKFANGLILQWGNASGAYGNNSNTTAFPIAFSTACYSVNISQITDTSGSSYQFAPRVKSTSNTNFTWGANSGYCFWLAIGV